MWGLLETNLVRLLETNLVRFFSHFFSIECGPGDLHHGSSKFGLLGRSLSAFRENKQTFYVNWWNGLQRCCWIPAIRAATYFKFCNQNETVLYALFQNQCGPDWESLRAANCIWLGVSLLLETRSKNKTTVLIRVICLPNASCWNFVSGETRDRKNLVLVGKIVFIGNLFGK